jgi:hypothetical protein
LLNWKGFVELKLIFIVLLRLLVCEKWFVEKLSSLSGTFDFLELVLDNLFSKEYLLDDFTDFPLLIVLF